MQALGIVRELTAQPFQLGYDSVIILILGFEFLNLFVVPVGGELDHLKLPVFVLVLAAKIFSAACCRRTAF